MTAGPTFKVKRNGETVGLGRQTDVEHDPGRIEIRWFPGEGHRLGAVIAAPISEGMYSIAEPEVP